MVQRDDPQCAIADHRQLQVTQVTPPNIPLPIFDTGELVAGYDPAPDLDPPGAQEAPAFCGRYQVRPYSRRSVHPSALTPPYAVCTGSNVQEAHAVVGGAAS